jgi:hypothetical protein
MAQVQIARPSAASLYLQLRSNGIELASATGFLVEHEARLYLVTNRHVIRGRNNQTDQPLSPSGALPDSITVFHNVAGALGRWIGHVAASTDFVLGFSHDRLSSSRSI